MNRILLSFLLVLSILSKTSLNKSPFRSPRSTSQQLKKVICMSLSRMHIDEHMESIEQALDSEDQETTRKLASLLDSSYRKCMRSVDNQHLQRLQKLATYDQLDGQTEQMEEVFGDVEYERGGKLVEPFQREEGGEVRNKDKQVKTQHAGSEEKRHQRQSQNLDQKTDITKRRERNGKSEEASGLDHSLIDDSNEGLSVLDSVSNEEQHHEQGTSLDEQASSAVDEPPEDLHIELQKPLENQTRSILVYFYPLVILSGAIYFAISKTYLTITARRKTILKSVDLSQALIAQNEPPVEIMAYPLDVVSKVVKSYKGKEVYKKVLLNYLIYLREKAREDPSKAFKRELFKTDKELALFPFGNLQSYTDRDLQFLLKDGKSLFRMVENMSAFDDLMKKKVILGIYPYVRGKIRAYIQSYMESTPQPQARVFDKFLFDRREISQLNERLGYLGMNQFREMDFIEDIVEVVARRFKNSKLGQQVVEKIVDQDHPKEERVILFSLTMSSYFMYSHHNFKKTYGRVSQMTFSEIFNEYLRFSRSKNFQKLSSIFGLMKATKGGNKDDVYRLYAFSDDCAFKDTVELFKHQFIRVYNKSAVELLTRIRRCDVEVGEYYNDICRIMRPYKDKEEVQTMLDVLQYCKIFYTFGVQRSYSFIEKVLKREERGTLQLHAKKLNEELLQGYCSKKYEGRKLVVNSKSLDLANPESLFDIADFLKQKLFKNLLQDMEIYNSIFRVLINNWAMYNGKSAVAALLKQEFVRDHNISHQILVSELEQFISNSLEACESKEEFQRLDTYVNELVALLNKNIFEDWNPFETPLRLKLVKYLWAQGLQIEPATILKKIDVSLLDYCFTNPKIDEMVLYKSILEIKDKNPPKNLETKEFKYWQGTKAKYLYKMLKNEEARKILREIGATNPPSWFCGLLIEIMKEYPESQRDLIEMAFEHAFTGQHLEEIQKIHSSLSAKESASFIKPPIPSYSLDGTFVTKGNDYIKLISNRKLKEPRYKDQEFEMLFTLLASNIDHALFYALKKQLPVTLVEQFLVACKEAKCVDKGHRTVEWIFRFLLYSLTNKYFSDAPSFSLFKTPLSQEDLLPESALIQKFISLTNNNKITLPEKQLLTRYHSLSRGSVYNLRPDFFNHQQFNQRKEWLLSTDDYTKETLYNLQRTLASVEIDLLEEAISTLCYMVNTRDREKLNTQFYKKVLCLISLSSDSCKRTIDGIVIHLQMVGDMVWLFKKLRSFNYPMFNTTLESYNLDILESLSKVEEENEFKGFVPQGFLYTPIEEKRGQVLSLNHQDILSNALKPNNVFVVGRVLFLFYGLSQNVEQEVHKLFLSKYECTQPQIAKWFRETKFALAESK